MSTPLPGENLRRFYDRSRQSRVSSLLLLFTSNTPSGQYWASKAYQQSGSRGKVLRGEGFELAKGKYEEYKPILDEIERIQADAEVDAAASKRVVAASIERNRR